MAAHTAAPSSTALRYESMYATSFEPPTQPALLDWPTARLHPNADVALLRLPLEVLDVILDALPIADQRRFRCSCRILYVSCAPRWLASLPRLSWDRFLEITRPLLDEKAPSWAGQALAACKSVAVEVIGPSDNRCSEHRQASALTDAFIRGQGRVISSDVCSVLGQLAKRLRASRAIQYIFECPPTDLRPLFEALSEAATTSIHLELRIRESSPRHPASPRPTLYSGPGADLFSIPGWQAFDPTNLVSLSLATPLRSERSLTVSVPALDSLLERSKSLESLTLCGVSSNPSRPTWGLLTQLGRYTWPSLKRLHLHNWAAPDKLTFTDFLNRHGLLESLYFHGPIQADSETWPVHQPAPGDAWPRAGTFLWSADGTISVDLPQLRSISVSSRHLLKVLLLSSEPREMMHVRVNVGVGLQDLEEEEPQHLRFDRCSELRRLGIIFEGIGLSFDAIEGHLDRLPGTLEELTIRCPEVPSRAAAFREYLEPFKFPLITLEACQALSSLTLPQETLISLNEREWEEPPRYDPGDPEMIDRWHAARWSRKAVKQKWRTIDAQHRAYRLARYAARLLPCLRRIAFIGSQDLDDNQLPAWPLHPLDDIDRPYFSLLIERASRSGHAPHEDAFAISSGRNALPQLSLVDWEAQRVRQEMVHIDWLNIDPQDRGSPDRDFGRLQGVMEDVGGDLDAEMQGHDLDVAAFEPQGEGEDDMQHGGESSSTATETRNAGRGSESAGRTLVTMGVDGWSNSAASNERTGGSATATLFKLPRTSPLQILIRMPSEACQCAECYRQEGHPVSCQKCEGLGSSNPPRSLQLPFIESYFYGPETE